MKSSSVKVLFAIIVSLLLVLLEFLYIFETMRMIGTDAGVLRLLNDPGKNVFHLVLLPISVFLLLSTFPLLLVPQIWTHLVVRSSNWVHRFQGVFLLLTLPVLVGAAVILVRADIGVATSPARVTSPSQFRDDTLRHSLLELDQALRAHVRAHPATLNAELAYRSALHETLTPPENLPATVAAAWANCQQQRPQAISAKDLSLRAFLGFALSWAGAVSAAFVVFTVTAAAFLRHRNAFSSKSFDSLLLALVLLTVWLAIRPYSEWYNSFYDSGSAGVLIIGLIAAAVAGLFSYLYGSKSSPLTTAAVVGGLGIVSTAFTLTDSSFAIGIFKGLAESSVYMAIAQVLIVFVIVAFGLWLAGERSSESNSTETSPS